MMLYTTLLVAGVIGILANVQGFPAQFKDPEDTAIWPIPQKNQTIRWMTEEEAILEALQTEAEEEDSKLQEKEVRTNTKSDYVRFLLYTKQNPTEPFELKTNDLESLKNSPFDPNNPTRFMIHGFNGHYLGEENTVIREALLLNVEKRKFNFISVDWSVYSETLNYISAKNKCSKTGVIVAEFIDWMYESGDLSFDNLAVYGHSLGAHIAGFAGKNIKLGQINTIIGLDPAMPLFSVNKPEKRLSRTDAKYVETIHTNGGLLGFYDPIGVTSFYPNGGRTQPGCENDIAGICSHIRSAYYLAEALKFSNMNGLRGVRCKNFESLKNGDCSQNQFAARSSLGDPNNAGSTFGIFYLETNSESPFGIYN
ncbi:phospholipase A1-like [Eupeodes corollae]|uniref:phospholipase A1-like n=1 Tax=Eupeodes corollae TaxID=290404 RepID=UPI002491B2A8|nr:phospholipase A1-like [Eupeodes corollae]